MVRNEEREEDWAGFGVSFEARAVAATKTKATGCVCHRIFPPSCPRSPLALSLLRLAAASSTAVPIGGDDSAASRLGRRRCEWECWWVCRHPKKKKKKKEVPRGGGTEGMMSASSGRLFRRRCVVVPVHERVLVPARILVSSQREEKNSLKDHSWERTNNWRKWIGICPSRWD